jgi:hypothetical protein
MHARIGAISDGWAPISRNVSKPASIAWSIARLNKTG